VWDLAKHQKLAGRLGDEGSIGVGFTCLSSDGRFLAYHHLAEGQPPKAVVWDIEGQKQHAELPGTNVVGMYPFALLPQTPGLIVGWIGSSGQVRGFTLWDFIAGRILETYESAHRSTDLNCSGDVAFTPDGKLFMTGDADGWVWVWDTTTLKLRGAFRAHERPITGLALSPDGKILATAQAYVGTSIHLWDFEKLQRDFEQLQEDDLRNLRWGDFKELQRKVEKRPLFELEGHVGWVSDLAFSQTGLLASGAVDHTVRVWDLATRKEKCRFLGQLGEVLSVRFSPDGRRVYSSGLNGRFCAFSVDSAPRQNGPEVRPLLLRSMSPSPDGRRLAMVKQDGTASILTLGSENLIEPLPELGTNNTKILFSADRQRVFVARRSHQLDLAELVVWDPEAQPRTRVLDGALDVRFLERSQDGRVLLAIDWAGEVRVWRTGGWTGNSWRTPRVHCCALSPDGRWLATELGKGLVHIRDAWTGQLLHELTHDQESAQTLAWSLDRGFIAAAAWAGIITVWETKSWQKAARLRPPHRPLAIAFSTDGRRLATGSAVPDAVKLWDTSTWRELFTLEAEAGKLSELIFTADAERLLGRNAAGELLIWSAPPLSQVDDGAIDESR
jgi:WD40 repeat protein